MGPMGSEPHKQDVTERGEVVHINRHIVMTCQGLRFCCKCGKFTTRHQLGNLTEECKLVPANKTAEHRRKCMLEGRHPITKQFLGVPAVFTAAQWQDVI